jgi:hypothetical protein
LARLAKRDELRKRTEDAPGGHHPALEEVTDAVRRVVERHRDLSVTVYAQEGETAAEVRVAWANDEVQVTVLATDEGPVQPTPTPWTATEASANGAAARLAAMIRQDPSLLAGHDEHVRD